MAKVFYVHWHQAEAEAEVSRLREAGHEVEVHWSSSDHMRWGDAAPGVVVISLDRLPSHGRQIAEWIWEAKKRQSIPIVFAGGQPDKVAAAREQFRHAHFCGREEIPEVVARLTGG